MRVYGGGRVFKLGNPWNMLSMSQVVERQRCIGLDPIQFSRPLFFFYKMELQNHM